MQKDSRGLAPCGGYRFRTVLTVAVIFFRGLPDICHLGVIVRNYLRISSIDAATHSKVLWEGSTPGKGISDIFVLGGELLLARLWRMDTGGSETIESVKRLERTPSGPSNRARVAVKWMKRTKNNKIANARPRLLAERAQQSDLLISSRPELSLRCLQRRLPALLPCAAWACTP
jgi:hypothetical protein